MQVIDAGATTDGQGLDLAVYSPKTQSCWYAVDLESTPAVLTDPTDAGIPFSEDWCTRQTGATTAGVFYAQKKPRCGLGHQLQRELVPRPRLRSSGDRATRLRDWTNCVVSAS